MIAALTETLTAQADLALPLIAALALLEALVGIGLFVSGAFLLAVASFCLIEGLAPASAIGLAALCGALTGDQAGFWIGRRLGPSFHSSALARRHAAKIARADGLIARWGGIAIPIGRFVPAIRSLIPAALGVSGFDPRRFALIDLVSCAAWATALVGLSAGIERLFA